MPIAQSKRKALILVAVVALAVLLYVVVIRGLLFGFLHDHEMLGWYGDLLDAYNKLTRSGAGRGPHPLEEYRQRMDILLLQIAVVAAVVFAAKYVLQTKQRRLLLLINIVIISVALVAVELFLRTDTMQRRLGGWDYILQDRAISRAHMKRENSLGFTDRERSREGDGNTFRIAVLGDSFIWGDGVPNLDDVWTHRLEAKLIQEFGDTVEVLTWGRRGWSTHRQLAFLQGEGSEFEIDYLLVGYVFNDPHIPERSMPRRTFVWDKVVKKMLPFLKNTTLVVTDVINNALYSLPYFDNWGYWGWQRQLYSDENLEKYEVILRDLQRVCQDREIEYQFVITPSWHTRELRSEAIPLLEIFDSLGIPYIDLRPAFDDAFGGFSAKQVREELWANPADSHPSPRLHGFFADEVFDFLVDEGLTGR